MLGSLPAGGHRVSQGMSHRRASEANSERVKTGQGTPSGGPPECRLTWWGPGLAAVSRSAPVSQGRLADLVEGEFSSRAEGRRFGPGLAVETSSSVRDSREIVPRASAARVGAAPAGCLWGRGVRARFRLGGLPLGECHGLERLRRIGTTSGLLGSRPSWDVLASHLGGYGVSPKRTRSDRRLHFARGLRPSPMPDASRDRAPARSHRPVGSGD